MDASGENIENVYLIVSLSRLLNSETTNKQVFAL
jgi:hypothetical protein